MATDETASIHQLHQPRPKSAAQRAKEYRARQRGKTPVAKQFAPPSSEHLIPLDIPVTAANNFAPPPTVTFPDAVVEGYRVTPSRPNAAPIMLTVAAVALAGVGVTMNGWFARSLGSTDVAGYLFLAVGVAADIAALALPACAARHWQAGHPGTAGVAWLVWCATFLFAITAGIGFASLNIADVTMARSERVTPAVTNAQTAVSDAMTARDRECKGGVGKFCREREQAVLSAVTAHQAAMAAVAGTSDPQSQAAIRMVAWASRGALAPTEADFAMLRLALLALLPQIGGILMMVGRRG